MRAPRAGFLPCSAGEGERFAWQPFIRQQGNHMAVIGSADELLARAIGRFRAAIEANGIATASWWDTQLDLCLTAIMATFGWEKALGDDHELSWWENRVTQAARRQGIGVPGTAG
jgi:hypothetical protein